MLTSRRISLVLCLSALFLVLLISSALAVGPASVTVRVEGATATVLGPTQLTTTTAPVEKEGHSCSGTSAAGALQLATAGNWSGSWFAEGGFFVETIEGVSYAGSPTDYWTFWLDDKPSPKGICEVELEAGDSILFFPECFGECPPPPNPLGIEAPAVADVGTPVTVTVASYANASGARSAAVGAEVLYEGAKAITDANGHATLNFAKAGEERVQVLASQSIRTETTICVRSEVGSGCGSTVTAPGATPPAGVRASGTSVPPTSYKGPYALVASVNGIASGHFYRRGMAPRLLAGMIHAHDAVSSVSLELRREYRGRCSAYDGARERFRPARCGRGAFFEVARSGTFSYLLPAKLGPGRYVLDIQATDAAGNRTVLARGSSRVVFYVR